MESLNKNQTYYFLKLNTVFRDCREFSEMMRLPNLVGRTAFCVYCYLAGSHANTSGLLIKYIGNSATPCTINDLVADCDYIMTAEEIEMSLGFLKKFGFLYESASVDGAIAINGLATNPKDLLVAPILHDKNHVALVLGMFSCENVSYKTLQRRTKEKQEMIAYEEAIEDINSSQMLEYSEENREDYLTIEDLKKELGISRQAVEKAIAKYHLEDKVKKDTNDKRGKKYYQKSLLTILKRNGVGGKNKPATKPATKPAAKNSKTCNLQPNCSKTCNQKNSVNTQKIETCNQMDNLSL